MENDLYIVGLASYSEQFESGYGVGRIMIVTKKPQKWIKEKIGLEVTRDEIKKETKDNKIFIRSMQREKYNEFIGYGGIIGCERYEIEKEVKEFVTYIEKKYLEEVEKDYK